MLIILLKDLHVSYQRTPWLALQQLLSSLLRFDQMVTCLHVFYLHRTIVHFTDIHSANTCVNIIIILYMLYFVD